MLTEIDLFDDESFDHLEQSSVTDTGNTADESTRIIETQKSRTRSHSTPNTSITRSDISSTVYLELNKIKKNIFDWKFSLPLLLFNTMESITLSPHCIVSDSIPIKILSSVILISYLIHRHFIYASSQRFLMGIKPDLLAQHLVRNNEICQIRQTNQTKAFSILLFFYRICIEATTVTLGSLFISEKINHQKFDFYYLFTLLLFFTTASIESIIELGFSILSLRYRSDTNVVGSIPEYFINSVASFMSHYYHFFSLGRSISTLTLFAALSYDLAYLSDVSNEKISITLRFLPMLWTFFLELNRGLSIREARITFKNKRKLGIIFQLLNFSFVAYFFRSSCNLAAISPYILIPFAALDVALFVLSGLLLKSAMNTLNHWVCEVLCIGGIQLGLFILSSVAAHLSCSQALTKKALQLLSSSSFLALISATSFSYMLEPYYSDPTGIVFFSSYITLLLSLGIPRSFNDKILLQAALFKPQEPVTEKVTGSKSDSVLTHLSESQSVFNTVYGSTSRTATCTEPNNPSAESKQSNNTQHECLTP